MAGTIDLGRLEHELAAALAADQKYERENNAKFRAVNQKVASYEEFRDIVLASHLSPLEHKDITGGGPIKQPWNTVAAGRHVSRTSEGKVESDGGKILTCNPQKLVREWRKVRGNVTEQYRFLMTLVSDQVHSMVAIDASLLGELLVILEKHYQPEDCTHVVNTLNALATTPRFALSVDFLNTQEKTSVHLLFSQLSASKDQLTTDQQTVLTSLYDTYKIPRQQP